MDFIKTMINPIGKLKSDAGGLLRDRKISRALDIANYRTTFQKYGAIFIPIIVLSVMGLMFLIYWFNRGSTADEQKQADTIFTGIMSVLGIAFALAGIYSMPYLTGSAIANIAHRYGAALEYYETEVAPPNFTFSDGSYSDKCGQVYESGAADMPPDALSKLRACVDKNSDLSLNSKYVSAK